MTTLPDQAKVERWLDEIEAHGTNLTTWEAEFVEAMQVRRDLGNTFTPKQAEVIERIYAERTP